MNTDDEHDRVQIGWHGQTFSAGRRDFMAPGPETVLRLPIDHSDDLYDDEVDAFYRDSAGKVRGCLIRSGCDRGLAEEITDDAFLAARKRWQHVRGLDQPEAYVLKIAWHERSKRQPIHDSRAKNLNPDPVTAARERDAVPDFAELFAARADLQHDLKQALAALPPSWRDVVILRDLADLSEAATAQVMGISKGAVKTYLSRGRSRLRDLLTHPGHGPERTIG